LDSATASFFINEEVGHFQRIKIVFAQISLSPFENEEVGLFQRIKIVFAQISLSPFENEEVGHFPANHTAQSRNERFGEMGHSARYGMLMLVVCEIMKSKRCN
jgi:hypothetical protein